MLKGFVSGIAICLVVAAATLTFVGITSAHSDQPSGSSSIWSGLWQGVMVGSSSAGNPADSVSEIEQISAQMPETPDLTPSMPAASTTYAALGDSVASGLGLPYAADTSRQDRRCGRSSLAYAHEVGRQLNYTTALYACSGASSGDLYTRQWISNSNPHIQLNQAFEQGTPALISITVGANDIAWSRLIRQCYYGTCGTTSQTEELEEDLADMRDNLRHALTQIEIRSHRAPPTVILTGYYNPISAQCAALYPERISQEEVGWISDGVDALNRTLQATISQHDSFARFASIDFGGHDFCSNTPWVQGLADNAPIHPTSEGQQAIARSVVAAARR